MSLLSKLFGGNKEQGGNGGGGSRAQEFISRLTTDLKLTPEQVSGVEAALREFFSEKKEIKGSGGGKDALRDSKQDFKQDILKVLNPEQQHQFMANIQTYKQLLRH